MGDRRWRPPPPPPRPLSPVPPATSGDRRAAVPICARRRQRRRCHDQDAALEGAEWEDAALAGRPSSGRRGPAVPEVAATVSPAPLTGDARVSATAMGGGGCRCQPASSRPAAGGGRCSGGGWRCRRWGFHGRGARPTTWSSSRDRGLNAALLPRHGGAGRFRRRCAADSTTPPPPPVPPSRSPLRRRGASSSPIIFLGHHDTSPHCRGGDRRRTRRSRHHVPVRLTLS